MVQLQDSEAIRRVFWQIYIFDKSLSLRLGKPSAIPEFDSDLRHVPISEDTSRAPWDNALVECSQFARLQGCIYDQLYSSEAKKLNETERNVVVSDLSARLSRWYEGWCRIDSSHVFSQTSFKNTFDPMHVVYYSTMTLLYRGATTAKSPLDISPRCFEAAQQGLQAHLAYYSSLNSSGTRCFSSYSLW